MFRGLLCVTARAGWVRAISFLRAGEKVNIPLRLAQAHEQTR